jgi:hypothetical protein
MSDDAIDLTPDEADSMDADERTRRDRERMRERQGVSQQELAEQNLEALDKRLKGLRHASDRIEEADDEQLVMQQLEGDVLVEIPPDEREEVQEKIDNLVSQLEDQKEKLRQTMVSDGQLSDTIS